MRRDPVEMVAAATFTRALAETMKTQIPTEAKLEQLAKSAFAGAAVFERHLAKFEADLDAADAARESSRPRPGSGG